MGWLRMALEGTCGSQHRCGTLRCFGIVSPGIPQKKTLGTGRRRVGGGICRDVSRIVVRDSPGIGHIVVAHWIHFVQRIHRFVVGGWIGTSLGSNCNGGWCIVVAVVAVVALVALVAQRCCFRRCSLRRCRRQRRRVGVVLGVGAFVPLDRRCRSDRGFPLDSQPSQFGH